MTTETLDLSYTEFGASVIVTEEMLRSSFGDDFTHNRLTAMMHTKVLTHTILNEPQVVASYAFVSVWQLFKYKYMPTWYQARYPAKRVQQLQQVTFRRATLFPFCNQRYPEQLGMGIRLEYIS